MASSDLSIIKLNDILVIPISDNLDDETVSDLQDKVLTKVHKHNPIGVIIDLSTVNLIDSFFARMLTETVKMISLMGTRSVLAGMGSTVAITTTQLGLEISGASRAMNVDEALKTLRNGGKDDSN